MKHIVPRNGAPPTAYAAKKKEQKATKTHAEAAGKKGPQNFEGKAETKIGGSPRNVDEKKMQKYCEIMTRTQIHETPKKGTYTKVLQSSII